MAQSSWLRRRARARAGAFARGIAPSIVFSEGDGADESEGEGLVAPSQT